jgi:hypothetical protein
MKKIIIYQVDFSFDMEFYADFEEFLYDSVIPFYDINIEIFSGYDQTSVFDAIEISTYFGLDKIFRHDSLTKNPENIRESLSDILTLIGLRKYDMLFLISHLEQTLYLPNLIGKHYFKKEKSYVTIPGTIIMVDLDLEEFRTFLPYPMTN